MHRLGVEHLASVWVWVSTIAFAIVLAASTGLRAWLPLLITSALARFELVEVGESFAFLATTPALVLFSIATVVEIAGDKIPAVDHALDVVSTFIRPATASLLAAAVMWKAEDPLLAAVLGIAIGAPVALVPHAAKAAVRTVSSTTTGGFGNPLISAIEDFLSFAMAIFAVLLPVLSLIVLVVVAVLGVRAYRRRKARQVTA